MARLSVSRLGIPKRAHAHAQRALPQFSSGQCADYCQRRSGSGETGRRGEYGFDWIAENNRLSFTLFHDDLSELIANATIKSDPDAHPPSAEKLSNSLSRGIETSYRYQWHNWAADVNYLFADARLTNGLRLAQVPKQQGTGGVTYAKDSTLVSVGLRAFGLQFDDDLNQSSCRATRAADCRAAARLP